MTHEELREYWTLRSKYGIGHAWVRDLVDLAKEALRDHSISALDQDQDQDRDRAKDFLRLAYLKLLYQEIPDQDLVVIRDANVTEGMGVWYRAEAGPQAVVLTGISLLNARKNPRTTPLPSPFSRKSPPTSTRTETMKIYAVLTQVDGEPAVTHKYAATQQLANAIVSEVTLEYIAEGATFLPDNSLEGLKYVRVHDKDVVIYVKSVEVEE